MSKEDEGEGSEVSAVAAAEKDNGRGTGGASPFVSRVHMSAHCKKRQRERSISNNEMELAVEDTTSQPGSNVACTLLGGGITVVTKTECSVEVAATAWRAFRQNLPPFRN